MTTFRADVVVLVGENSGNSVKYLKISIGKQ